MHALFPRSAVGPPQEAVRTIPKICIPISDNSIRFVVIVVNKNKDLCTILAARR